MTHLIEMKAISSLLLGIISCKCPVTQETEKKLFDELSRSIGQETVPFQPFLDIVDTNPQKTPVHNLFEFCFCSRDEPLNFVITVNDVLRYLGSAVHYNMVLSNNPGIVTENPELLVSHLLLPMTVASTGDRETAVYETEHARIFFSPVFAPAGITREHGMYAVHMGVVISGITQEQATMLHAQQSLINGFTPLTEKLQAIDLTTLKPYGDHFSRVKERYKPYEGIV